MRIRRRVVSWAVCCVVLAGGVRAQASDAAGGRDEVSATLAKAATYLWLQQAADGGWHSPQYGVLRSGQALTPFVLDALLQTVGDMSSDEAGRVLRAAKFMIERVDEKGALGRFDPQVTEYPVYSTGYGVRCLSRIQSYHHLVGPSGDRTIARMREYLIAAQYDEEDGFEAGDPAYGGWGFQNALKPGKPGHMDLSHTRQALEALAATPWTPAAPESVRDKAQVFLRLMQKHPDATAPTPLPFDGGFYFSPVVLHANKGRLEDQPAPHWRSYATATCDGILALLAAGVPRDDPRVRAAAGWLEQHSDVDYPQGVPRAHPEPWGEAIRFYHYAVRGEVYHKLNFPADKRARLAAAVIKHQRPDGSFLNTVSPLMKEDDPVLCTAVAVVALANCLP